MKSGPEKSKTQESKSSARDTQRGGVALSPLAYGVGVVDKGAAVARPNRTGLPDKLKAGVESLSGLSMDDVRVHYNSPKPAQLQALAYTQGTDIHVGPGQEKHVPHEAWHVVQQARGRVQATMQMKGVGVNDDAGLEREADEMGGRAEYQPISTLPPVREPPFGVDGASRILQRQPVIQFVFPTSAEACTNGVVQDGSEVSIEELDSLLDDLNDAMGEGPSEPEPQGQPQIQSTPDDEETLLAHVKAVMGELEVEDIEEKSISELQQQHNIKASERALLSKVADMLQQAGFDESGVSKMMNVATQWLVSASGTHRSSSTPRVASLGPLPDDSLQSHGYTQEQAEAIRRDQEELHRMLREVGIGDEQQEQSHPLVAFQAPSEDSLVDRGFTSAQSAAIREQQLHAALEALMVAKLRHHRWEASCIDEALDPTPFCGKNPGEKVRKLNKDYVFRPDDRMRHTQGTASIESTKIAESIQAIRQGVSPEFAIADAWLLGFAEKNHCKATFEQGGYSSMNTEEKVRFWARQGFNIAQLNDPRFFEEKHLKRNTIPGDKLLGATQSIHESAIPDLLFARGEKLAAVAFYLNLKKEKGWLAKMAWDVRDIVGKAMFWSTLQQVDPVLTGRGGGLSADQGGSDLANAVGADKARRDWSALKAKAGSGGASGAGIGASTYISEMAQAPGHSAADAALIGGAVGSPLAVLGILTQVIADIEAWIKSPRENLANTILTALHTLYGAAANLCDIGKTAGSLTFQVGAVESQASGSLLMGFDPSVAGAIAQIGSTVFGAAALAAGIFKMAQGGVQVVQAATALVRLRGAHAESSALLGAVLSDATRGQAAKAIAGIGNIATGAMLVAGGAVTIALAGNPAGPALIAAAAVLGGVVALALYFIGKYNDKQLTKKVIAASLSKVVDSLSDEELATVLSRCGYLPDDYSGFANDCRNGLSVALAELGNNGDRNSDAHRHLVSKFGVAPHGDGKYSAAGIRQRFAN